MTELIPFTLDDLRGLRGMDRQLAVQRFRVWRENERARDWCLVNAWRSRQYCAEKPEVVRKIKERHKQKKYILAWFLYTEKYVKGDVMNKEELRNKIISLLEENKEQTIYDLSAKLDKPPSYLYGHLRVMESLGLVFGELRGRRVVWKPKLPETPVNEVGENKILFGRV